MNKRQIDRYTMLHAVENYFENSAAIWSSNALISDAKADLSGKIAQIKVMAEQQLAKSKGATEDKAELRKDLEVKAFFISKAICVFTSLNPGHNLLHKTVFISKTNLAKLREADFLLYIERLEEAAVSILENLAPYGVSQDSIIDMMTARGAFYDIMTRPAEIISNRKEASEAISVLIHQAIAILNNTMDGLMELLQTSEPHFVNVYFSQRKIHNIAKRTMSLEITTLNAIDKTPLASAKIEVIGTKIKRISGENGLNKVQNLKQGNYTLSVSHENFVSQLIPFTILKGETTQLVVEMEEVSESLRL